MDLVVDSCVAIAALIAEDSCHEAARHFFSAALERHDTLWAPSTILWDVSARFVHPKEPIYVTVPEDHGVKVKLIDVTGDLFFRNQAQTHLRLVGNELRVVRSSIRGPDHVFISCALEKMSPLVTWDGKLREQAGKFGVAVLTPDDYLAGVAPGETCPIPSSQDVLAEIQRRWGRRE